MNIYLEAVHMRVMIMVRLDSGYMRAPPLLRVYALHSQIITNKSRVIPQHHPLVIQHISPLIHPICLRSIQVGIQHMFQPIFPQIFRRKSLISTTDLSHDPTEYPSKYPTKNPVFAVTVYLENVSTSNTIDLSESQVTTEYVSPEVPQSESDDLFSKRNMIYIVVGAGFVCFCCMLLFAMCIKTQNERQKRQQKYVIKRHVMEQHVTTQHVMQQHVTTISLAGTENRNIASKLSFQDTINDTTIGGICLDESSEDGGLMSAHVNRNSVVEMGKSNVLRWLTDDVKLPKYYDCFMQNGYECLLFVKDIDRKSELAEIGIKLPGHQTRLMKQIQLLKEAESNVNTDPPRMPNQNEISKCEGVPDHNSSLPEGEAGDSNVFACNPLLDSSIPMDEFKTIGDADIDMITIGLSDDSDLDLDDIHLEMVTMQ
eukprot:616253_1